MSDDEQRYTDKEREALEAVLDEMNFDRGIPKSALSGTDRS